MTIAAIGEKPFRIAESALLSPIDLGNARPIER
jgi:hypothetical protein